ncbi:MAG: glycosyltransferase [Oscillospiraceae bacterium]|nr:glycosyltransferase [Oscillospiraceae bacterium]
MTEAVESILDQTFSDFVFLIIDDASTDTTPDILSRYAAQDSRIKIITNERNLGLTASLNKGLSHIDTPYIARMDADDISLPERLEKQLAFMEGRPEIVALGCWAESIDAMGVSTESSWFTHIQQYLEPVDIHKALLMGNSILVHPSMMLRTAVLKAVDGYRVCFRYAQDYELWLRLLPVGKLAVLPEVLLRYRISTQAISTTKRHEQQIAVVSALSTALIRERGEADPLQNCDEILDYNRLEQLMDAAGAVAWLHWLELNSYGETKLADKEISSISNKIIDLDWYDGTAEDQARHIRISDLWLSNLHSRTIELGGYIEDLLEGKKYLENRTIELENYIEDLLGRITELGDYIEDLLEGKKYLENRTIELENYIEDLLGRITELETERDRFAATCQMYQNSMSWKITAPLRKIATVFQKIKKSFDKKSFDI